VNGGLPYSVVVANELSWTVYVLPFIEQDPLFRQVSLANGAYTATGKNNPHGLTRLNLYLCPSSPAERMQMNAPHNVNPPDQVPMSTGEAPFTLHYYGIAGPRGTNPATGAAYPTTGTVHEGVPVATSGMWRSDTTAAGGPGRVRLTDVTDGTANTYMLAEMSWFSSYGTRYRSWLRGGDSSGLVCGARNMTNALNAGLTANMMTPYLDVPFGSMHTGGANFGVGDGTVRFVRDSIAIGTYRALGSRNGGEVANDN
jgi:hypothetical protein